MSVLDGYLLLRVIISRFSGILGNFWPFLGQKWPKMAWKSENIQYWPLPRQNNCSEWNFWCNGVWYVHISTRHNLWILKKSAEKPEILKIAIKNFPQSFGTGIGAHFFYFSTQMTNQVRKKRPQRVVTELRFLTQLYQKKIVT